MDEELFELCKEVSQKTHWETGYWLSEVTNTKNGGVSLYTSDYLLERLPREIARDEHSYFYADLFLEPGVDGYWKAGYRVGASFPDKCSTSNTPLKALLGLVIELHDAGELK